MLGIPFELSYNSRTHRYLLTCPPGVLAEEAIAHALASPPPGPEDCDRLLATLSPAIHHAPQEGILKSAARLIVPQIARYLLLRWLTPPWLRPLTTLLRAWPYLREGAEDLARGRMSVGLLDATAIAASLMQRKFDTAGSIAFLLGLGSSVEEWTREQSRASLSVLFRTEEHPVWVLRDGIETQVPYDDLAVHDRVIVRMGSRIPVDGVVEAGEATVNQSAMTGEALALEKRVGLSVLAGTVVEEGELVIRAERVGNDTRFARVLHLIEASEAMQAEVVSEFERLATGTVPYVFLASVVVGLLTRNWTRATSVLVVDFSCALKLATPLALKSAMLEAARRGVLFKGGKHLETLARSNVFVLDKTGTLTEARPHVVGVHAFGGYSRDYVLRNAACLEEHFPHPVATAIVRQAQHEGLRHEERHAKVEYVLAHGIASTLDGERVVVGSRHFVTNHEAVDVAEAEDLVMEAAATGRGVIYFAVGGRLAGVLVIEDTLLAEAPGVLAKLHELNQARLVLMTGDTLGAARRVGERVGISEVHAEVLPDQKSALIRGLQAQGGVVAMLGDGVNDSAALAAADVGLSFRHGADIAREAADVLLLDGRLESLVEAVAISRLALARVRRTFGFSVGANSLLMILGVFGAAPTAWLAVFHNASTVASCVWSLRPYLPYGQGPRDPGAKRETDGD